MVFEWKGARAGAVRGGGWSIVSRAGKRGEGKVWSLVQRCRRDGGRWATRGRGTGGWGATSPERATWPDGWGQVKHTLSSVAPHFSDEVEVRLDGGGQEGEEQEHSGHRGQSGEHHRGLS